MKPRTTATISSALATALALSLVSMAGATVFGEQDTRIVCNEAGQQSLPRRLTIWQVVDDPFFATAARVEVGVAASYLFRFDVNSGRVVATGVLVKPDGSEHALPRVAGRMSGGDADKSKPTDLEFNPGDMIEWTVKMKGLAPLEGLDCWSLTVGLAATDSTSGGSSGMITMGTLKRANR